MRKAFILLVLALVLVVAGKAWAGEELRIYMWSEYIDPEIPKQFEEKFGIKVRIDLFESNEEMMAKLQAGGISQYDLITPTDYILPSLIQLDLLLPLDHSKIPNMKNLGAKFTNTAFDPGNKFTAPYQWGTVGIMYRKDKVTQEEAHSWSLLFDPAKEKGPFILIDSVREMMGIALSYLGYDFNSDNMEELKKATELLLEVKKRQNCLGFEGGVGGKNKVVAGVATAAIVYNGDALRAIVEDPENLGFVVPKEGSEIWMDNMCIPAKAPNAEAAYKFINYILDAEIGAQLSNWNQYATPNEASKPMITPEDLANPAMYPPAEDLAVLHFVKDLAGKTRLYDEAWTMIKSR